MQFFTPYTPDSIPSFCSLLEHYRATIKEKKNNKGWAKAAIAQKTWAKAYYRTRASEAQNHRCCYCGVEMQTKPECKNSITLERIGNTILNNTIKIRGTGNSKSLRHAYILHFEFVEPHAQLTHT